MSKKAKAEEKSLPRTTSVLELSDNVATLFQQGTNYCEKQQWGNAEQCYAHALQKASLESSYTLQYQSAERLAGLYERYGKRDKVPDEALDAWLKATALLNYALRVREKELSEQKKEDAISQQLRAKIANLETWFLRKLKRDPSNNRYRYPKASLRHQASLKSLREDVRKQLVPLAEDLTRMSKQPATLKTHEDWLNAEAAWSQSVQKLYSTITGNMKSFVRKLLQECIDTLGKPPCEYAVLGFGSFARGEVTPYSDLEFGFLLPECKTTESNKHFFRNLTRLLHLKVINIGETILPAMAIPSLQALDFYDNIVPRGFAFDGQMSRACKTPLGKKTLWLAAKQKRIMGYELIGTAQDFLKLQSPEWYNKDPLLPGEVANSTWMAGKKGLVSHYQALLCKSKHSNPNRLQAKLHLSTLLDDLRKYATTVDNQDKIGALFNAKKELYRFLSLMIGTLAQWHGGLSGNTWQELVALQRAGVLTKEARHNLSHALCISNFVRLSTYLANHGQREDLSAVWLRRSKPADARTSQRVFQLKHTAALFRYYYTVLPFEMALRTWASEQVQSTLPSKSQIDDNPKKRSACASFPNIL